MSSQFQAKNPQKKQAMDISSIALMFVILKNRKKHSNTDNSKTPMNNRIS